MNTVQETHLVNNNMDGTVKEFLGGRIIPIVEL